MNLRRCWTWLNRATVQTRLSQTIGLALVALAIASVVILTTYTVNLHHITQCQTAYNDAFAAANLERAEAARQDRAAIRDFLTALAAPGITRETAQHARDTYLRRLDEADQRRDQHPLPNRRCG